MFELSKLCNAYERATSAERAVLLREKSSSIIHVLGNMSIPGISDPIKALAGFIVGSVAFDGKVNEMEYFIMYPALVHVFGEDFDFASLKRAFRSERDVRKIVNDYKDKMVSILDFLDDEMKWEVITLCLAVFAVDGKVSLKEKLYIRRLWSMGTDK